MSEEGVVKVTEKDGVAFLALGNAEEKAVTFDEKRMNSLRETLTALRNRNDLKGVVVCGPKPNMFCAGADINLIQAVDNAAHGESLAKLGQDIFNLLDDLPQRTVAAISGPCVGGGYELALACDFRIAADLPATRIGLPEIKLGILPGFGGTQRLPRLIGLPKALDIILKGKVVAARHAKATGLIDELLPTEENEDALFKKLHDRAAEIARGVRVPERRPLTLIDRVLTWTGIGRGIVEKKARASVNAETKGFYPAPIQALESAVHGLTGNLTDGLARERQKVGKLVVTPESKSLVHVFIASEEAQKLGRSAKAEATKLPVAVVGGGTMGSGIATSLIAAGYKVTVVEPVAAARERVRGHVQKSLEKRRNLSESERGKLLSQLAVTEKLEDVRGAAFLVEAIVEDTKIKRELFEAAAKVLDDKAIIASNTSSLPISSLAEGFPFASRVVGMHFFNPVEKMPLVEIIRGKETSDRAVAVTAALTAALSKYPVVVDDVPGFLVNKILTPYLMEAAWLLREGVSIRDIDRAATSFGFPMGPLRLLDEIGLDVAEKVSKTMETAYGVRMADVGYTGTLVQSGRLGKKSKLGFYRYEGESEVPDDAGVRTVLKLENTQSTLTASEVSERLVLSMVNEALRSFEEGLAGNPSPEAQNQVDLASVMGFGFPPFRGGVLHYVNRRGRDDIKKTLQAFQKKFGERFAPWDA